MVESLRHVERAILDAQITRGPTSRMLLSIENSLRDLGGGIRDVDGPSLAALRRRV